jgi:hypothetical protein
MLRAEILITPHGESRVSIEPDPPDMGELFQLILCYGAKLRWSLLKESRWVREVFEQLTAEAAELWCSRAPGPLLSRLPSIERVRLKARELEVGGSRYERYIVQLYGDEFGRGYPCEATPPEPLRINLIWHFLALLDALESRLDHQQRAATQPALLKWWLSMFAHPSRLGPGSSLNEHIALANAIHAATKIPARASLPPDRRLTASST